MNENDHQASDIFHTSVNQPLQGSQDAGYGAVDTLPFLDGNVQQMHAVFPKGPTVSSFGKEAAFVWKGRTCDVSKDHALNGVNNSELEVEHLGRGESSPENFDEELNQNFELVGGYSSPNCKVKELPIHSTTRLISKESKTVKKQCRRCNKELITDFCLCIFKSPLYCEKCSLTFSTLTDFRTHVHENHPKEKTRHSERPSQPRTLLQTVGHNSTSVGNSSTQNTTYTHCSGVTYDCSNCKEKFNTKLGLMAHNLNHLERRETDSYKCNHCNREFLSTVRLSIHVTRMHIEAKKFNCGVCNKGFSSAATLEAHKRLHLGIKPYKCDICGKGYSQSGNLAYHKSTHVGVKSHVCHLCGKAFLTSGILANHERRHTGLKPYVCDVCGRAFADNYTLTHHKATHSGVRSYMCDVCGKAFVHKHTLASHKRIHSGEKRYKCAICERAFTQMSTMLQHKNTHTGEKSYRCSCGKAFTQQSSLARHKRLHEGGIESFPCHLCEKKFAYKSTLYKHRRRTHGIENPHFTFTENHMYLNLP